MTTAEEWVAGFSRRLGLAEPDEEEVARILDLARVAAHQSERRAAPLACWLAATAGLSPGEALGVAKSLEPPSTQANPEPTT
ncbi:MAG: DUF6457 domain-containing protein [Actinomycetota bacterium]|nr:DUF6457 domain-containing protein [Actinomycetota bacterium]